MQIRPTHFFCGDCGVEGMWKYVCIQAHIQSACVHGYRNARKRITEVQTMEKRSALIGCESNRRNRNTSDRLFLFLVFKCGCSFPRFLPFLSISTLSLFFTHFPVCVHSLYITMLVFLCFVSGLSWLRNNQPAEWNFLFHTFHTTWTLKTNANLVIVWLIKKWGPPFSYICSQYFSHLSMFTLEVKLETQASANIWVCNDITKMVWTNNKS